VEELVVKLSKELEELKKLNSEAKSVIRAIAIREKLIREVKFMLKKSKDGYGLQVAVLVAE
jgi:hypothetical protein